MTATTESVRLLRPRFCSTGYTRTHPANLTSLRSPSP